MFRAVLETGPAAVCLLGADGSVRYATPDAARLLGVPGEELPGRAIETCIAAEYADSVRLVLREFGKRPGGTREFEFEAASADGRGRYLGGTWLDRRDSPPVSAIVLVLRDLTDVRRAVALQSALYRIAAKASAVGEMHDFYAAVHAIIGELLDAKNFSIAILDPESDTITFPYSVDGRGDGSSAPRRPGKSLTGLVLRSGQPLSVTEETFAAMAARGEVDPGGAPPADWLGVPLKIGGATIGVLAVESDAPARRYVETEKKILTYVSQHVASALAHRRAVDALRASEERYRQLFERNLAGVFRSTLDGRLLDCNDAFVRIYGYDSREEVLRLDTHALYPAPSSRAALIEELERSGSAVNVEERGRRKDGSPVWILQSVSLVSGGPGRPSLLEGTLVDITDRKRAEEEIQHLAFHDALTGLPNRALFHDRLALALSRCRREGLRLAVLFLDLDRFKGINDSLGHSAGDRLLQEVAQRLRRCVREEDTIARVGGDEFVIVTEGLASAEEARNVAEKVRREISEPPFTIAGRDLAVTASIGVGVFPDHGSEAERLVRVADDAMYGVKSSGRNASALALSGS